MMVRARSARRALADSCIGAILPIYSLGMWPCQVVFGLDGGLALPFYPI